MQSQLSVRDNIINEQKKLLDTHKIQSQRPIRYNEVKSITEISQEIKLLFPLIEKNQYLMSQKKPNSPIKKKQDIKLPTIERKNYLASQTKNGPLRVNQSSELIEMSSLSAKNYLLKKPAFSIKNNDY